MLAVAVAVAVPVVVAMLDHDVWQLSPQSLLMTAFLPLLLLLKAIATDIYFLMYSNSCSYNGRRGDRLELPSVAGSSLAVGFGGLRI